MTLDISNPAHVEALRWACVSLGPLRDGHTVGVPVELASIPDVRRHCLEALAASIVRDILAMRGVTICETLNIRPPTGHVQVWPHDARAGDERGGQWVMVGLSDIVVAVTMANLPALILALLDATTPEAALDALRKAER